MKESRDILSLFEALNSHEIFTPPRVARQMLDLLPQEIWSDPSIKILDPSAKSGVFLRESFYRLFTYLDGKGIYKTDSGEIYDLNNKQQRINHILKNMLFGIATSELTAYVSRRTLYGVMRANSDKQLSAIEAFEQSSNFHQWTEQEKYNFIGRNKFNEYFDHNLFCTPDYEGFEEEGNIFYPNDEVKKLVMEEDDYEIEDKYFPFIEENTKHKKILEIRGGVMRFDVVISNPPYQKSDGGDADGRTRGGAVPVYNKFVETAKSLNPKHLVMIIPSRWYSGGRGLDEFRKSMLTDKRIKEIHDFPVSTDCFPGVSVKGGVCYFYRGDAEFSECKITTYEDGIASVMTRPLLEDGADVFIRFNPSVSIYRKVTEKSELSFASLVSSQKPFGLRTFEQGEPSSLPGRISLYTNKGINYYQRSKITSNEQCIDKHKVLITMAYGAGEAFPHQIINKPIYAPPGSACTETYLMIGPFESKNISENVISYMKTKFFRFLVLLRKSTQHAARGVYTFVPVQDFNIHWTDEKLYEKYGLNQEEIQFIEKMIRVME
ncbi:Eco57I restriction-modification methylase domain-containing protein [Acinetobacter towneri]|uniref:Eco57I restriction-modification methylase domain-containing protein n=1 Tax=Acinetobacter towneri TaxID=202956 RepID=UPI002DBBE71B|nr:Eco57I restriction-modification methylase domain-containing protein [Acinetobacter towneri]MEB6564012.1 Eco57I restriction-modification methylase domain-containing protein [Acinetobacter towneri]